MDIGSVRQRVAEFHKRHGECVSDGAAWYYRDGAIRDADPTGLLAEPPDPSSPEGEYALCRNKLRFCEIKLEIAVQQFDHAHTRLEHTIPADPEDELRQLKRLQRAVEQCKAEVAHAQEALNATQWGRQRAAMQRGRAEEQARFAQFHRLRRTIRI